MIYMSVLKTLWEFKWVILFGLIVGVLSATTFYYKGMYEHERQQHSKTISEYKQQLKMIENQYLLNVTKQQQEFLELYYRNDKIVENLVKHQEKSNENITNMSNDINSSVKRLQSQISTNNTTPNNSGDKGGSNQDNSISTKRIQRVEQLSTECISEYQKMGRYADQERVAKETLQESWKVIQEEYNK